MINILLSLRGQLFGSTLHNITIRRASERNANGHSIGHQYTTARCNLGVGECLARSLDLIVEMNSHLFVSLKDFLQPLKLLLS